MILKLKKSLILLMFIGLSVQSVSGVFAYGDNANTTNNDTPPTKLENPLGEGMTDPNLFIGKVINGFLGIVGSLALAIFIWGGFNYMMGTKESVQKGKDSLIYATYGMIIIFTAYAVINFVLRDVLGVG